MDSWLSLNCPCDSALRWTKEHLTQAGLRTVQTFDLQSARHASGDCPCPHHGTAECDCQMVVLLVYGGTDDVSTPLTLVLHGSDGQTRFSIADDPARQADRKQIAAM
ncbi:MAG: hypothetical protein ACP5QU_10380 [Anaerolineae bacterium]